LRHRILIIRDVGIPKKCSTIEDNKIFRNVKDEMSKL